jgi:hypothetical protein
MASSGSQLGRREVASLEKKATCVMQAFQGAVSASVEMQLEYIETQLRANTSLLYTLSSMVRDDSLVSLLDGRMMSTATSSASQNTPGKNKERADKPLRQSLKSFKHLAQMSGLVRVFHK